jgi:simple sugar transport system permease protein
VADTDERAKGATVVTEQAESATAVAAQKRSPRDTLVDGLVSLLQFREVSIVVVAIVIAILFQAINRAFLTTEVPVLLSTAAQYGLIAIGETMLMITGEIDLSAAKIYSTTPFIAYYLTLINVPFVVALILALAGAAVIGMVNGLITVRFGLPSLITTLGMLFFLDGVTLTVTHSEPVTTPVEQPVNTFLGQGQQAPIGGAATYAGFIWLVLCVLILTLVLYRTRFGMHTIAVGSNLLAAREIGIRTERTKVMNFMIMGVVAGLAGIIQAVATGSTDPSAGDPVLSLYGIAATVMGGTSLFGGSGTVIGALVGAFVISSLNNGLPLIGAQATMSFIIVGLAIVLAMILNVKVGSLRGRRLSGLRGTRAQAVPSAVRGKR